MAAGERPSSLWSRGLGWGSPSAETAQWVFVRPENSNTDRSMCVIPWEDYRLSPFLQFCCPPLEKEGQKTKPKWAVFLVFILWQQQLWSSEGHKRNTLLRHWAKRSKWSPCFASEKNMRLWGENCRFTSVQLEMCAPWKHPLWLPLHR